MAEHISEEWRPVVGFEGAYEVSNTGQIRSLTRPVRGRSGGIRSTRAMVRKQTMQPNGYFAVGLSEGGEFKLAYTHSAVLQAFVGPRPERMQVRHLDGNKTNNHLSNLRYGSVRENTIDQVRHGVHSFANRTHCPRGHELAGENLAPGKKAHGKRECRACSQARSFFWKHRDSTRTFQEVSDWKYAAITGKAVPNG